MASDVTPAELAFMFQRQFEGSKVVRGNQIVLVTDNNTRLDYVHAAFAAADRIGARIFEVKVPNPFKQSQIASSGGGVIASMPGILEAIYSADYVMVFHVAFGAPWVQEGRRRGVRFLMITDGPDELKRLASPPGLKEAVLYTRDIMVNSRTMRVTSPAGTDFRCELGELGSECQYGLADEPGHIDNWGGAHSAFWPNPGSSEGKIILKPGDSCVLPHVRFIESNVEMTIEKGYIRKVEGEGVDAKLIRDYLERNRRGADDLRPYAISHLGWGVHPNAALDQLALHPNDMSRINSDARAWPGVFLFSTGPNDQGGGDNSTLAHLDLPMMDCTVYMDGKPVILNGRLNDEGMLASTYSREELAA